MSVHALRVALDFVEARIGIAFRQLDAEFERVRTRINGKESYARGEYETRFLGNDADRPASAHHFCKFAQDAADIWIGLREKLFERETSAGMPDVRGDKSLTAFRALP